MEPTTENWHAEPTQKVLESLETSEIGLTTQQVTTNLSKYGYNVLDKKAKRTIFNMIVDQFKEPMVLILLAAAALSMIIGALGDGSECIDGGIILGIIFINGIISIIQERKATSALEALEKISAPKAKVLRDGKLTTIDAKNLVPGDVVYIEDGCIVPADLRLFKTNNLKIQEASLTGESEAVEKDGNAQLKDDAVLGDRINIAYNSTVVTYGNGYGVVIASGMKTEIGRIAGLLSKQEEPISPLKRQLSVFIKWLTIIGACLCLLIFVVDWAYANFSTANNLSAMTEAIITAIALAVSVIPEGLLATMTIIMAIGVQKMTKRNAIVKKLDTIQTLGSVSIICTDKTGTLTQNKMSVVKIANYDDINTQHIVNVDSLDVNNYQEIINCGILCNNATIDAIDKDIIHGDPTEGALLNLGLTNKLDNANIIATNKRLSELPFDSVRKMMSTINDVNGKTICYTKGAIELLIKKCKYVYSNGGVIPITDEIINQIDACVTNLSSQAFRVLGFASHEVERNNNYKNAENELTFLGLVCMIDPPRLEVIDSIKTCAAAGIKTVMITGDHVLTAKAIGKQIGLFKEHHMAIDGVQLAQMSDEELDKQVQNVTVFARVSPSDKLRIVNSFQKQAEIVAMTGDGVNDAPALKSADIGIAMGKSGTDVAKQSANMLLLDDSFTTIGKAVFEGRKIYNNLKKVIEFLLTGNVCEVLVMLILIVTGCVAPLTGVQILIMNLITETAPSLALGLEPAEYNIMSTPPLKNNRIFTKAVILRFIYHCSVITGLSLGAYFIGLHIGGTMIDNGITTAPTANVMVFLTMSLSQVFHTMNLKSVSLSLFGKHNKNNKILLIANASIIVFVVTLVFIPGLNVGLNTDGLYHVSNANWVASLFFISIGLAISIIPFVELEKYIVSKIINKRTIAHNQYN